MLHLHSATSDRWLTQVDAHLSDILIDHAHCEQKAASTAMNLMFDYVDNRQLCEEMTEIITEELEHFHMVLKVLQDRGIRFHKLKPGTYGRQLKELVRRQEPDKAVDRLLIAGLIEARSCERFLKLSEHLKDGELSRFYGDLCESEARHATYTRLAMAYADEAIVRERLEQLSREEATIIDTGCALPRVHS